MRRASLFLLVVFTLVLASSPASAEKLASAQTGAVLTGQAEATTAPAGATGVQITSTVTATPTLGPIGTSTAITTAQPMSTSVPATGSTTTSGLVMQATRIVGKGVRSMNGDDLGDIANLLIDVGPLSSAITGTTGSSLTGTATPLAGIGTPATSALTGTTTSGTSTPAAGMAPITGTAPAAMATSTPESGGLGATAGVTNTTSAATGLASAGGGHVAYGVVAFGGFLGIGQTRVLVPWSAFHYDANENVFFVNFSRETLHNAPGFNPDDLPTSTANPSWDADIRAYWATYLSTTGGVSQPSIQPSPVATVSVGALGTTTPMTGTLGTSTPMTGTLGTSTPTAGASVTAGQSMTATVSAPITGTIAMTTTTGNGATLPATTGSVLSLDQIVDSAVKNASGDTLGDIADLLIDLGTGVVTGAPGANATPSAILGAPGATGALTGTMGLATPAPGEAGLAGASAPITGTSAITATTTAATGATAATGGPSTSGRVVYGIVAYGGFLGIGETRVLVPWSGFTYDPNEKVFMVNTTRQVLDNVPGFNPGNLPTDTSNPDWDLPIRSYWQQQGMNVR